MSLTTSAQQILHRARQDGSNDFPDQIWELIERYRAELINQAVAILGSVQDAEDVVQESFCEAYHKRQRLAEARSLGAWLRSINRANALDRLRGRKRDPSQQDTSPDKAVTGGFGLLEKRESLAQAIEALPEQMRTVVILRYWEHLGYEDIARRMDMPTTTVWALFYDACQKLCDKMEGQPQAPKLRNKTSGRLTK